MELNEFQFKRIKLSEKATMRCRIFKSRTGLTPNIACRLALAISISESNKPDLNLYTDDSGQEITRYTLLGDHEASLLALFALWCREHKITNAEYYAYLMAHINRGVEFLVNRVKGIEDLTNLIESDT